MNVNRGINNMKFFKKNEIVNILIIIVVLTAVIIQNLIVSYRRGRDATRKDDISVLQQMAEFYYNKYGVYPLSTEDGQIIGCFEKGEILDLSTGFPINAIPCKWGESKLQNGQLTPRDPDYQRGASYKYLSNDGSNYSVYVSLEGKDESEYQIETESENLQCGTRVCNYKRVVK